MNLKKIGLALAASALILSGQRLRAVFRKKASPAPQAQTEPRKFKKLSMNS